MNFQVQEHDGKLVRVGDYVVRSQVGWVTGDHTRVERDVVGGRSKGAVPTSVYSITVNPESPKSEKIAWALQEAFKISVPDAEALLSGTAAVLVELDGTNFFLVVELLRALGLSFGVGTRS